MKNLKQIKMNGTSKITSELYTPLRECKLVGFSNENVLPILIKYLRKCEKRK